MKTLINIIGFILLIGPLLGTTIYLATWERINVNHALWLALTPVGFVILLLNLPIK